MREDDVQQGDQFSPDDLLDQTDPTNPGAPTPKATARPVAGQPLDPTTPQSQPAAPTAPGAADNLTALQGLTSPATKGSGDTGYDWLGFTQKFTGNPNTSRGGSQGGFIPGGGAYRGQLQSLVDAYNKEFGTQAKVAGEDKIDFGDGRGPQDVITGGGDFWYGGPPGSMQRGSPAGGGGGAGSGSGGVGSASSSLTAGFGSDDPAIHDAIMALLGRGSQPVTGDDPAIKAQFDPISRQLDRGAQRTREQSAERLAFEGLNNGGQGGPLDADVNAINESLGEQKGAAMGKFVTNELQARRQDVVNALSLAQGSQRIALQAQLQQIDAKLREQALTQQNSQFYDTFASGLANQNNLSDYEMMRALGLD